MGKAPTQRPRAAGEPEVPRARHCGTRRAASYQIDEAFGRGPKEHVQGPIDGEIPAGVNRYIDEGEEEDDTIGPGEIDELAGQVAGTRPSGEQQ